MFVETIYVHRDWKNDQGPLLKATRSLSTCPKVGVSEFHQAANTKHAHKSSLP